MVRKTNRCVKRSAKVGESLRYRAGGTYNQIRDLGAVSLVLWWGCAVPISVERFLQALAATGIMTPDEVQSLAQSLSAENRSSDADELARNLVRQGKLTRFQAAAIYQDKSDGLLLGNYLILDKLVPAAWGRCFCSTPTDGSYRRSQSAFEKTA